MSFDIGKSPYRGRKEPSIRWGSGGNKYALIRLAPEGGQVHPASERVALTANNVLKHPRSLVFGERSGGGRNFLAWLMSSRQGKMRWVFARGYHWQPEHFDFSKSVDEADRESISNHLMGFAKSKTAAERAQHLVQWARTLETEEPIHLLIRDLGGLGKDIAEDAAQALRIFGETLEQSPAIKLQLKILLVSTSEERFEDRFDASGFAIMCHRYRLPWLEADEVEALVQDQLSNEALETGARLPTEALEELMLATGGQPLLVQEILSLMASEGLFESGMSVNQAAIKKCYRYLRRQPPSAAKLWRKDLTIRLQELDGLREKLRFYVSNNTKGKAEIDRLEHSLMYSGWIRFDQPMKRWKISSKLHRDQARAVLTGGGEP